MQTDLATHSDSTGLGPKGSLIEVGARGVTLSSLEDAVRFARLVTRAEIAPANLNSPEKVAVAVMTGMELGFPPMQALNAVVVVRNRTSLYGANALALVLASGLCELNSYDYGGGDGDKQEEGFHCWVKVQRKGMPPHTARFSIADAKEKKLWNKSGTAWPDHWRKMLYWRALDLALTSQFADVLKGLRIAEAIRDVSDGQMPPDDAPKKLLATVLDEPPGGKDPLVSMVTTHSRPAATVAVEPPAKVVEIEPSTAASPTDPEEFAAPDVVGGGEPSVEPLPFCGTCGKKAESCVCESKPKRSPRLEEGAAPSDTPTPEAAAPIVKPGRVEIENEVRERCGVKMKALIAGLSDIVEKNEDPIGCVKSIGIQLAQPSQDRPTTQGEWLSLAKEIVDIREKF